MNERMAFFAPRQGPKQTLRKTSNAISVANGRCIAHPRSLSPFPAD